MEKDDATGLNHTRWRKDDNWSGRWTSPDPYGGSMSTVDPQLEKLSQSRLNDSRSTIGLS